MNGFKVKISRRGIPKAEIIEDILAIAKKLNKDKLTADEYDQHGIFGKTTVLRKFGSWNNAITESGLGIVNRINIPETELMENFADVWQKLGRQPVGRDFKNIDGLSKISLGTYEKRYGSWTKFLLKFKDYIEGGEMVSESAQPAPKGRTRRTDRKINWRLRAKILIRDNCICKMCGASPAKNPEVNLHIDHIKPWAKGGETEEDNLQTLCDKCNIGKSDEEF